MVTDAATAIPIKQHSVSINCGEVTVYLETTVTRHLWMLSAVRPPLINEEPPIQKPPSRAHRLSYKLVAEKGLEQAEDGQTLDHTFPFTLPIMQGRLFYMFIATNSSGQKFAQTPIFCFDILFSPLVIETFSKSPDGDLGWNRDAGINSTVTIGNNRAVIMNQTSFDIANINLGLGGIPELAGQLPCDLVVVADITSAPLGFHNGYATFSFGQSSISPPVATEAHALVMGLNGAADTPRTAYDFASAATGPVGYGRHVFSLGQLLYHAGNGKAGSGGPPNPSVPVNNVAFYANTGGSTPAPVKAGLIINRVAFGTLGPSVVRRDRQWRSLANPIFDILDLTP